MGSQGWRETAPVQGWGWPGGEDNSAGRGWPRGGREAGEPAGERRQIKREEVANSSEDQERGRFLENYLGRGAGSQEIMESVWRKADGKQSSPSPE